MPLLVCFTMPDYSRKLREWVTLPLIIYHHTEHLGHFNIGRHELIGTDFSVIRNFKKHVINARCIYGGRYSHQIAIT